MPARPVRQDRRAVRCEAECPIRSRGDWSVYLKRRASNPAITARVPGRGRRARGLSGDLANIDRLFDAGVRMMAPTHFFDNDLGVLRRASTRAG